LIVNTGPLGVFTTTSISYFLSSTKVDSVSVGPCSYYRNFPGESWDHGYNLGCIRTTTTVTTLKLVSDSIDLELDYPSSSTYVEN
jgi:hypothetical protein